MQLLQDLVIFESQQNKTSNNNSIVFIPNDDTNRFNIFYFSAKYAKSKNVNNTIQE